MSRTWFGGWRKQQARRFPRQNRATRSDEAVLVIEGLEDRTLLSVITWTNSSGGNWDVAANWSTGSVPGPSNTAIINTAAAATIHRLGRRPHQRRQCDGRTMWMLAGNFTQTATGTLNVRIGSSAGGQLGPIAVSKAATVAAVAGTKYPIAKLAADLRRERRPRSPEVSNPENAWIHCRAG